RNRRRHHPQDLTCTRIGRQGRDLTKSRSDAPRGNVRFDAPRRVCDLSLEIGVTDRDAKRRNSRYHAERGNEMFSSAWERDVGYFSAARGSAINFRSSGSICVTSYAVSTTFPWADTSQYSGTD